MPYSEQKPCFYLTSYWHDHKRRLYNANIIHKIEEKLVSLFMWKVENVSSRNNREDPVGVIGNDRDWNLAPNDWKNFFFK